MIEPGMPANEKERLKVLRELGILDTTTEQEFDEFSFLASQICQTPMAIISLVDQERQWFKSTYGIDGKETPRNLSFCAHAITQDATLHVEDSEQDERFVGNPLAKDLNIRFYAGAVLKSSSGHNLGTLCVLDKTPRKLTEDQIVALELLAHKVTTLIEYRAVIKKFDESLKGLEKKAEDIASYTQQELLDELRHEINNSLMIISGQAQILAKSNQNMEMIKSIEKIMRSVKRISDSLK